MDEETRTDQTGEERTEASAEAWQRVLDRFDELGEALGRWASAAVDDPENRERAEELKTRVEGVADRIGDAMDEATRTDVGHGVKDAATKAGDALKDFGGRFTGEVAPRMADAFEFAAERLRDAAEQMERSGAAGGDTSQDDAPVGDTGSGGDTESAEEAAEDYIP